MQQAAQVSTCLPSETHQAVTVLNFFLPGRAQHTAPCRGFESQQGHLAIEPMKYTLGSSDLGLLGNIWNQSLLSNLAHVFTCERQSFLGTLLLTS